MKASIKKGVKLPPIQRPPTKPAFVKTVQGPTSKHLEVRVEKPPVVLEPQKKKRGKPTKAIEERVRRQKEARNRRKAEALRLYESGMDVQEIADTMGIKRSLVFDYARGVRETKTKAERYKYDADMIRMYNEGKTYVQMADALGVELWKVNQICKRLRESGKVQGRNKTWYVRR